jgi:hypothetical protein
MKTAATFPWTVPASARRLLTPSDLTFRGSFRLPTNQNPPGSPANSFAYMTTGLCTFNPNGNGGKGSLYISGNNAGNNVNSPLVAEVSIPTPVISNNLNSLPTAAFLQPFGDLSSGLLASVFPPSLSPNGRRYGGGHIEGGKFYGSVWSYYDGNNKQFGAFFVADLSTTTPNAKGMFDLTTDILEYDQGHAGWIQPIPPAFQAMFGGATHYCGLATGPISENSSAGPCVVVFKLADLGMTPAQAEVFLYYNLSQPAGALYSQLWEHFYYASAVAAGTGAGPVPGYNVGDPIPSLPCTYFMMNTEYVSCFIDTGALYGLLFVDNNAASATSWYGLGKYTTGAAAENQPPDQSWVDPCNQSDKGLHSLNGTPPTFVIHDPYAIAANKNGGGKPWSVGGVGQPQQPQLAPLGGPTSPNFWLSKVCARIDGGDYDQVGKALYLVQANGNGADPLVHVYGVEPE